MKYNDNGEYKDIYVKSLDTLPVGTEVDFDGNEVPSGWEELTINKIAITPLSGSNFSYFGSSYYYKDGNRVCVHLGLESVTANQNTKIFTLPVEYRPSVMTPGSGLSDTANTSFGHITTSGDVYVNSQNGYVCIEFNFWI